MTVTLSGAIGSSMYTLDYTSTGAAYMEAQGLISSVDSHYTTAVQYTSGVTGTSTEALIVGTAASSSLIRASGFGALIIQNNMTNDSVRGGGDQVVLAGDGGLTFTSLTGNDTIDVGGGNNYINLAADTGSSAIYTGDGNDTIKASGGAATIVTGLGTSQVTFGAGADQLTLTGQDTVRLGGGNDTINVMGSGSAFVIGSSTAPTSGFALTFVGGSEASKVLAGAGSYSIFGGIGGGFFEGGTAGGNSIVGGAGAVTITGGGAGDTLLGGAGNDLIIAAAGNETLGGGEGNNVFQFYPVTGSSGSVYTIADFDTQGSHDLLHLGGGQAAINYALQHYTVGSGGDVISLSDGSTIVLAGFTSALTTADFKH